MKGRSLDESLMVSQAWGLSTGVNSGFLLASPHDWEREGGMIAYVQKQQGLAV